LILIILKIFVAVTKFVAVFLLPDPFWAYRIYESISGSAADIGRIQCAFKEKTKSWQNFPILTKN